jgi:hypothetical protein
MEIHVDDNRKSDRLQLSSRLTLAVGFGGLLVIMALAGMDALRVLQQVRRDDDQIRRQFLYRNHVLNDWSRNRSGQVRLGPACRQCAGSWNLRLPPTPAK